MSEEKKTAAAAKPKKEKLEDKPFQVFVNEDLLPAIKTTLGKVGVNDLNLTFEQKPLPVSGVNDINCWQIIGKFKGDQRQFRIGFLKEDIKGQKFFCCADNGAQPSLLESFMIDERKVTLDLIVLYTVQRLNGQKWLTAN